MNETSKNNKLKKDKTMTEYSNRIANSFDVIAKSVYVPGRKQGKQKQLYQKAIGDISRRAEISGFPIVRQFINSFPSPNDHKTLEKMIALPASVAMSRPSLLV